MAPSYSLSLLIVVIVVIVIVIIGVATPASTQSTAGFLSIDIGSGETTNYTETTTGMIWTPDLNLWPDIGDWSTTYTSLAPPPSAASSDHSRAEHYQSFRYFKPSSSESQSRAPRPAKFCYSLPAQPGKHYLVRATFWSGASLASASTRVSGLLGFYVMIDTYVAPRINISLPQTSEYVEEYFVKALDGASSSSVKVCLSAESDVSDAPFINALELRPLADTPKSVLVLDASNSALRTMARYDFGASVGSAPIIRFPDDTMDRWWLTSTTGPTNVTSNTLDLSGMTDVVPMVVMQTNVMAGTTAGLIYNFSLPGSHTYAINLYFIELDPAVGAGSRVFDVNLNGRPTVQNVDVFVGSSGLYKSYTVFTPNAFGPYVDYVLITVTPTASTLYLPSLSALELMQVFDNPMLVPTLSDDVLGIEAAIATLANLSIFRGDPCLPVDYKYPWIGCTEADSPPRVTSISLSNYSLGGTFPPSINNLDKLVQILLDGNALEGQLPELGNLLNLEVLNLSNNKLSGPIPASLGTLTKLKYLDLANNNFSGVIPTALQQKQGLDFRYEGNNFLCLVSNASCLGTPSPSPSSTNNAAPLIAGIVCSLLVIAVITTCVICICRRRRRKTRHQPLTSHVNKVQLNTGVSTASNTDYGDHVVSHTKVLEATNAAQTFSFEDIRMATNNFTTILGKGGFGTVYKGILRNGVVVAVKVLSDASKQGAEEFLNEVTLLSRVHHRNLVELVGYCIDNSLVLVYEFMSEGSFLDALFGNTRMQTPLKWRERLQILLDAAQGLAYLHTGCNALIIHRDVKSSNILLTEKLEGKMSDFGISRLQSHIDDKLTTKLIGTRGYLDPEYAVTSRLTEKVDVYSFGVVLFEAICGRLPLIRSDAKTGPNTEIHISEWVRPHYERGVIERVVDRRLGEEYNISSIWKVAEIAMACVQYEGIMRPTMNVVCNELMEALRLESVTVNPHGVSASSTTDFFSPTTDSVLAR